MTHQNQTPDLTGYRILVGRARPGASTIATRLRDLGADVLEAPKVDLEALPDPASIDQTLQNLHPYAAILFPCEASVENVLPRWTTRDRNPPIIAIGKQAAEALRRHHLTPQIVTDGACHQTLQTHLQHLANTTALCFTSTEGRPQLASDLLTLNIKIHTIPTYQTHYRMPPVTPHHLHLTIIPSSSAVPRLFNSPWSAILKQTPTVAIGESSAHAARIAGATNVVAAPNDTIDALIECAIQQLLQNNPPQQNQPAPYK